MTLMAPFGHGEISKLSPLSEVKLKSDFGAVTAAFDPDRASATSKDNWLDRPLRLPGVEFRQLYCCILSLGGGHEATRGYWAFGRRSDCLVSSSAGAAAW
jgi:hypothetical protein